MLEQARRCLCYHGIASLLHGKQELLEGWPGELLVSMREESLARAMREMRHRILIDAVIEALHGSDIRGDCPAARPAVQW